MTPPIETMMAELAEAERRLKLARDDLISVEAALDRAGSLAFMAALAARGIVKGSRIVIEGQYSRPWGGNIATLRHGSAPVEFIGASVDSAPATRPHPNSTDCSWWFRLAIARLKKDGTARDEYRHVLVCGDTPEAAAQEIKTP